MTLKDDWAFGEQFSHDDANDVASEVNANTTAIAGKADSSHSHAAGDVSSGTFDIARIPTGTSSTTVCVGNDSRLSNTRTPTDNTVSTAKIQDGAVTIGKTDFTVDEDDMSSDSAVKVPTQQSVKAYVTARVAATMNFSTVSNDTTLDVVPATPRTYVEDTGLTGAVTVTAQAGAVGWLLWVSLVGTAARAITWDSGDFEIGPAALPTTTVTTERLDTLFVWNTATSKWRCMNSGSK